MSQQKSANSAKYGVSAKFDQSAQIHGDDSAKTCCISINLTSQRNELIQQKIRGVSKNLLSYQNA